MNIKTNHELIRKTLYLIDWGFVLFWFFLQDVSVELEINFFNTDDLLQNTVAEMTC